MSHPPYSFGPSNDPGQQPPADPFQSSGYPPPYPDPTYGGDPGYQDPHHQQQGYPGNSGYQPTQPYQYPGQQGGYPSQPYSPAPGYPHQQGYGGQPPYPGYPGYPPEPPKGNKTGLIVAIVAVLLVLVVGGGVAAAFAFNHDKKPLATNSGGPSTGPSAPSTGSSTGGSDTGSTHSGDLRTYLVSMPSGAQKCEDEEGTDEKLSLDQASNLSSDPKDRKKDLQDDNFKGGAVRCWVTSDNTTVDIRLYQFGSTDKARSFFETDVQGTSRQYDADNTTDVTGVPDGKSFASPDKDSQGYVRVISIGQNGDVVLVVAIAQLPPLKVSNSDALLQQEYQKL